MVKLIGTGGNQVPTNNMLGNMAFQNKEGVSADLVSLAAGTAAAPSLIPSGDPNTGVWFPAADTIAASTNGSERLRIDSSGNVGIGNSSPSGRLDVAGNNVSLFLRSNDTNDSTLRYYVNSVEVATARGKTGNIFAIETGGSERMRITSAGDVGIGTASPSAKLSVTGGAFRVDNTLGFGATFNNTSAAGMYITFADTSNSSAIGTNGGNLIFYNASNTTERMRITNAGNVGIGTTSPNSLLEVRGTSTSFDGYIQVTTLAGGGGARTPAILLKDEYYANQGGLTGNYIASVYAGLNLELASSSTDVYTARSKITIGVGTGNGFVFSTSVDKGVNYTEAMRLNSNNNLGLGTSTFGTSAIKVMAIGSGTAPTTGPADTIQIYSSDLSAGNTMLSIFTEGTTVNANATAAATHRIAIRVNGTVYYLLANTSA